MKENEKVAPVQPKSKKEKEEIIRQTLFEATPDEDITEVIVKRDMINNTICYKRHKNNKFADYHCQQCGEEYTLCTNIEDPLCQAPLPAINQGFICPKCGEKGILKHLGHIKEINYSYNTVTYRLLKDGTLLITLYFSLVKRNINGSRRINNSESYRAYLRRNSTNVYEKYGSKWKKIPNIHYLYDNTRNSVAIGTGNIGLSDLKYCPLKDMAQVTFHYFYLNNNPNECYIKVLETYAKYPGIETLFKNGLYDIVSHVILKGSSTMIKKKETKANRILGISKEQYNWLVKYEGDRYVALEMIRKYKINTNDIQYINLIEGNMRYYETKREMETLEYAHRYLSYCQLYNYLDKQREKEKCLRNVLDEYVDYLKMRQIMGYDMTNSVYIRPKSLRRTYAALRTVYERQKNTIYEGKMELKYSQIATVAQKIQEKYNWHDKELLIRPAMSAVEIVREGKTLHHCVGNDEQRYMKNYNQNRAYILVIRHLDEPDIPYITVEIEKDNNIRQWYGINDTKPDRKLIESFLKKYSKYLNNKKLKKAV